MNLNNLFPICPNQTSNTTTYNCLGNTNIVIQSWDFILGCIAVVLIICILIVTISEYFNNKKTATSNNKANSEVENDTR